ncbi:MAG: 4-(cytidine 5'-diphospho)-2-C-methyl-D-erythritol kinase [Firmicutes bacterium]|nr:4-(cytidine 5'-diphospho)-2-C-methyl-D-erythritol kinase [Bacillota bacterium]
MFTIQAPAKVNLALDVLYKRPDGYHEVDMVMQAISLADELSFEDAPPREGIPQNQGRVPNEGQPWLELTCSDPRLPTGRDNLAWRAAELLQQETGINRSVRIHITKKIPVAAGLAGGSADAAAVLTGLNQFWGLGLTLGQLMELGVKLGADVPFCIFQGAARATGIGAGLTRIHSLCNHELLLVTPNFHVPTAYIYQKLDLKQHTRRPRVDRVVSALQKGDLAEVAANWGNVLEEVALREFPRIADVKTYFSKYGLPHNLMSGSGPSVFALNPPREIIPAFLANLPPHWFGCLVKMVN